MTRLVLEGFISLPSTGTTWYSRLMTVGVTEHHAPLRDRPSSQVGLGVDAPCPLCGYDLRGLPVGRCPECGHAFRLSELRLARKSQRAFFFEHHCGRPVRCFLRTLAATWRPRWFWRRLRPSMEVKRGRLALYATIVFAIALLSCTGGLVSEVADGWRSSHHFRRVNEADYWSAPAATRAYYDRFARMRGSPGHLARLKAEAPLPYEALYWKRLAWNHVIARGLPLGLLALFWPSATFATLAIFRRSLRQARIKPGHIARTVVYSGDVFAFIVPTLLALAAVFAISGVHVDDVIFVAPTAVQYILDILGRPDGAVFSAGIALLLIAAYRLWQAHRLYLRLPHATAIVLMSQLIVWLAILSIGGLVAGVL